MSARNPIPSPARPAPRAAVLAMSLIAMAPAACDEDGFPDELGERDGFVDDELGGDPLGDDELGERDGFVDDELGGDPSASSAAVLITRGDDQYGRTVVETPDGPAEVTFRVVDGHALVDGDIDLGEIDDLLDPHAPSRGLVAGNLWPGGIVHWQIGGLEEIFFPQLAQDIRDAVAEMDSLTDLTFIEGPSGNQIVFMVGAAGDVGGYSPVGMQGGTQYVTLNATGADKATVLHELGHAVGLYHEHQRGDRDDHVIVSYPCIDLMEWSNFDIKWWANHTSSYDIASIMHYDSYAFSLGVCPSMTRLDGSTFTRNTHLSRRDRLTLNTWY